MYIFSIILLILFSLLIFWFIKIIKGFEFTLFLTFTILYFLIFSSFGFFKALLFYLILFIIIKLYSFIKTKRNYEFSTYFGVPGSGKTTVAAALTKKFLKKGRDVYSNVPLKGAYQIDKSDIGTYKIEDGLLILDEAGIDFDNRNFKSNFSNGQVAWFKKHRHYHVDVVCFSQYWNDIDIKLRNLSTRLYLIKPSIIPFFIKRKTISKRIGIHDLNKDIIDEYSFVPFSGFYFFAPSVWKMFKTHDKEDLPVKEFKKYE